MSWIICESLIDSGELNHVFLSFCQSLSFDWRAQAIVYILISEEGLNFVLCYTYYGIFVPDVLCYCLLFVFYLIFAANI